MRQNSIRKIDQSILYLISDPIRDARSIISRAWLLLISRMFSLFIDVIKYPGLI